MADDNRTETDEHENEEAELLFWVATAAVEIREAANISAADVAYMAGKHPSTISRLEGHERWNREMDQILGVYAIIGKLRDARDVYAIALKKWKEEGKAPKLPERLTDPNGPLVLFRQRLGEVPSPPAEPDAPARPANRRAPSARKKRGAGGG